MQHNCTHTHTHAAGTIREQIILVLYLQCSLPTQVQLTFKSKHLNPLVPQYLLCVTVRGGERHTHTLTTEKVIFIYLFYSHISTLFDLNHIYNLHVIT